MNCGADSRYASKMDVFIVPLLILEISIEFCGKLGSISTTFYSRLLCVRIPKAQKDSQVINVFFAIFAFVRSVHVNSARKLLMKLAPGIHRCKSNNSFEITEINKYRDILIIIEITVKGA